MPDELPDRASGAPAAPGQSEGWSGSSLRLHRRLTALSLATNAIGAAAAVALVATGRTDVLSVAIFVAMCAVTLIGVEVGVHRLFAHRAFEAARAARAALAIAGAMAMQGPCLFWVAIHRRHHRFADRPGDPHSPRSAGGRRARWRAFWHAHLGWQLDPAHALPTEIDYVRYTRDLLRDPDLPRLEALYLPWVAIGFALPAIAGGLLGGGWQGALLGFLWGGPIRVFAVDQVIWSLNSVCHTFGTRPYPVDGSTNVWWHALVSFGAGWHNNHHAFPRSARVGLRGFELDGGYAVIRLLRALGLAWDVHEPDAAARMRRSQQAT